MYTDYDEACEATVSKAEAIRELRKHSMQEEDITLFLAEVGDRAEYKGSDVLGWLGY